MKLIIETNETDRVTKHVRVSTRGMQILLDLFAWIDMLEPFRLTTDAPEMTVGDSSPINEQNLNDSDEAWICAECGAFNMLWHTKKCVACLRPKNPTKPDELTPSPTPSFR